MTATEECYECEAAEPRTPSEKNALCEAGEDPNAWQRCLQCDVALCDRCYKDDEHECQRDGS